MGGQASSRLFIPSWSYSSPYIKQEKTLIPPITAGEVFSTYISVFNLLYTYLLNSCHILNARFSRCREDDLEVIVPPPNPSWMSYPLSFGLSPEALYLPGTKNSAFVGLFWAVIQEPLKSSSSIMWAVRKLLAEFYYVNCWKIDISE